MNGPQRHVYIELGACIDVPAGGMTVAITREDMAEIERDPTGWLLSYLGVDLKTYESWLELHGIPYCGAPGLSGRPCRRKSRRLTDKQRVDAEAHPLDWLAFHHRRRCHAHAHLDVELLQ